MREVVGHCMEYEGSRRTLYEVGGRSQGTIWSMREVVGHCMEYEGGRRTLYGFGGMLRELYGQEGGRMALT